VRGLRKSDRKSYNDTMARSIDVVLAEAMVGLAAAVVVPLALPLLRTDHRDGRDAPTYRAARAAVRVSGPMLAMALALRGHPIAMPLAAPWLVATFLVAVHALGRFATTPRRRVEETLLDLGGLYLPVGAAWAFAYVAGFPVLGFVGTQSLLTAAHFHYAGFGACVVLGLCGRALAGTRSMIYVPTAIVHGLGVALVAIGITTSPTVERVAAWLLAIAFVSGGLLLASLRRPLLIVAGAVTLLSGALAIHFASGGFAALSVDRFARMVRFHGVPNALGFVLLSVIAFRLRPPQSRAATAGTPFSRLSASGVVGPTFFDRTGAVDAARDAHGLIEDLTAYASKTFDPTRVHTSVRHFYEHTDEWMLEVVPSWQPGFRLGGKLFRAFATRIEQLALPTAIHKRPVHSRIVALDAARDGRDIPRGWVRTYADGAREAIYIAAYSSHARDGHRTMNIAFPLPFSNMTSILRLDLREDGGVALTTLARDEERDGDQGVYLVASGRGLRLPLDETIEVWPNADGSLEAIHDMWLFGIRYLRLEYRLART
jgi:hypothetical protein